ncbi:MAG TPA: oxygen-dependent coproporphyrinogen oxidase [Kofleriaceae bacterium]|nr:oxygen-dependent coproporphyrinogen oxidase [Kofleriaceae bacterium]
METTQVVSPLAHAGFDKAAEYFTQLQLDICAGLEAVDGGGTFKADAWDRPGGGGGVARVLEGGRVFEKAGVNWSYVYGELPAEMAAHMPGDGRQFRAAGVSLVLHPRSPMVPTTHANFRCLQKGNSVWFGGGADLTPYYFFRDDAEHFHRTLANTCDAHRPVGDYDRFKSWCDDYFFLPHRNETRGLGGIFFDYLGGKGEFEFDSMFAYIKAISAQFLPAYVPIVERRMAMPFTPEQKRWQLQRRGRYVEFNLIYDRGTIFGLKTNGRIESILMSLPPEVRWDYDVRAAAGSGEQQLLDHLKAIDWLGRVP